MLIWRDQAYFRALFYGNKMYNQYGVFNRT